MKNIIILGLIVLSVVLGFLLLSDEQTPAPSASGTDSNTVESTAGKEIDLSGRNLSEISKQILDDRSVSKLDVSNNNLTGSLPAEIRHLTNLEILIASDNSMTGIPAEIGQLSKLRIADFSNNDLSGLPLEIGNLSKLETLDLRGNPNISQHDIDLIQNEIPSANIITD